MKIISLKSLAVAALAVTAAAPSLAQSSVTVYGLLDVFVEFGKGDDSTVSLESGGLSGSRLGFKGSEDLGGGLSAKFQIESGIAADTGGVTQGGVMWGRQAHVGLYGGFGSISFGRQYIPQFIALDDTDPFGTGAGSAAESGIVSGFFRANNSILYNSPKLGDVSIMAMVALGESTTGSNSNNNLYSTDIRYAAGPLNAGVSLVRQNRATDAGVNATLVLLSGAYDFGAFKLTGGVQTVKDSTRAAATDDDRTEYYVGALVPFGEADTLSVGVGSGKTKDVANTRATQVSLGFSHLLSKRTTLYAVATAISNGDATNFAPVASTGGGNFPVSLGQDSSALQFGIRHRF